MLRGSVGLKIGLRAPSFYSFQKRYYQKGPNKHTMFLKLNSFTQEKEMNILPFRKEDRYHEIRVRQIDIHFGIEHSQITNGVITQKSDKLSLSRICIPR